MLSIGARLGPYEILAQIGEGGMGQVYRGTDTTLGRQVAIKILPDAFASDAERVARFEREAKTLASLNHPHIAAIYGFEQSGSTHALVMELVEGEDLSQRIARGAIPIDEALSIAKQIAEALEAAHEQNIIHRDLKPANIKIRPDGMAKVLDFGLAKGLVPEGAGATADFTQSPTITMPAITEAGLILGTAAYMSPEQARGRAVDKRADIWAFGAVLFEMLTGGRPFDGESLAETIGAVMHQEPVWSRLPVATPASVRTVLQRCLQKDPKLRLRDIGDVRLGLEGAFAAAADQPPASPTPTARSGRLVWTALGIAAAGMIGLAIPTVRHLSETPSAVPPETRVDIVTPDTDSPSSFALSPDGQQIVFVASGDGASRLWLRSLATTTAQPLAGTEGATSAFWAPDGRAIGFFAGSALKRLDLGGGTPQTLAPVVSGSGTWNADGVIVFSPGSYGPVMRVAATGGSTTPVTTLGPQQTGHFAPYFLPDGRRFLFSAGGSSDTAGIYLGALDGSAPTKLTPVASASVYLPASQTSLAEPSTSGWLLWMRGGTLVAQPLDLTKTALTGEPVPVADAVVGVSAAATGLMAYRTGGSSARQLTWVDRSGTARDAFGDQNSSLSIPRLSFDGHRVAVTRTVQGNRDVWLLDGTRTSRFTFDPAAETAVVWSPDGTRIAFNSPRAGQYDIYQKVTSGAVAEERLVTSDQTKTPSSWSVDGRFLLYASIDPQTRHDLWVTSPVDGQTPSVFLRTPFAERNGVFSPDGRWVAYESDELGRNEVYLRPFFAPGSASTPAPGGQLQVSTAGGIMPAWRRDGKELYYLNPAGAMMAVPITLTAATLDPGAPTTLFATRIVGGGTDSQQGRQYDVAPDGRFLINVELESADAPITLLQNWNPAKK